MKASTNVSAKTATILGRGRFGLGALTTKRCLAVLLLALLCLSVAWGPAAAAHAKSSARNVFSLDFINTDLIDVLKALSTQSGVNIVLTNSVEGKATLSLRNVTLEEALRLVSTSNGLDFAWVDVAYVVGKPEEIRAMRIKELSSRAISLRQASPKYVAEVLSKVTPDVVVSSQEGSPTLLLMGSDAALARAERVIAEVDVPAPPTSKLVRLSYADAERVAAMLREACPEATVQLGTVDNSVVITGDGMQMAQVDSLLKAVDVVPSASQAYTVVYQIRYANPEELKKTLVVRFPELVIIDAPRSDTPIIQQTKGASGATTSLLAAPQAAGGSSTTGASGVAGAALQVARVERLILMGAEYTVKQALDLLPQLDTPSRQVKIKAVISRVNRDKLRQVGIDWSSLGLGDGAVPVGVSERGRVTTGDDPFATRALRLGGFRRRALDFTGELRALEVKGYAKILSEPSVLTLDGRQVAFHSGDKIFFQTTIGFGISGTPILDIREIDVGVTLIVTPQINPNGEVTLTLAPSFSTASFRPGLNTDLPVVNERTAIASVRVKQGESVLIAGLVEDTVTDDVDKIPILGDIPILGEFFFTHTKKQHTQDELVILVTPEIIE